MGVGEAARDSKALEGAIRDLTAITGQPVTTRAKKSIAQFKLREGRDDQCASRFAVTAYGVPGPPAPSAALPHP